MVPLKKRLGQHLLTSVPVLERIVEAAGVQSGDWILEIGPGPGNLTRCLADRVATNGRIVAVEVDTAWRGSLDRLRRTHPWVEVHWGDILKVELASLLAIPHWGSSPRPPTGQESVRSGHSRPVEGAPWKVVANIPYYITAPIIEKMLQQRHCFAKMALLVQYEVATRINALQGRNVGVISYLVHYYSESRIAFEVAPSAFTPAPRVTSALLILSPRSQVAVDVPAEALFTLIRTAFGQRRKMLKSTLRSLPTLHQHGRTEEVLHMAGIAGDLRPENLTLEDFAALTRAYLLNEASPQTDQS